MSVTENENWKFDLSWFQEGILLKNKQASALLKVGFQIDVDYSLSLHQLHSRIVKNRDNIVQKEMPKVQIVKKERSSSSSSSEDKDIEPKEVKYHPKLTSKEHTFNVIQKEISRVRIVKKKRSSSSSSSGDEDNEQKEVESLTFGVKVHPKFPSKEEISKVQLVKKERSSSSSSSGEEGVEPKEVKNISTEVKFNPKLPSKEHTFDVVQKEMPKAQIIKIKNESSDSDSESDKEQRKREIEILKFPGVKPIIQALLHPQKDSDLDTRKTHLPHTSDDSSSESDEDVHKSHHLDVKPVLKLFERKRSEVEMEKSLEKKDTPSVNDLDIIKLRKIDSSSDSDSSSSDEDNKKKKKTLSTKIKEKISDVKKGIKTLVHQVLMTTKFF